MARFDKGVDYYTIGKVTFEVAFPEDAVCCRYCEWIRKTDDFGRFYCALNHKMVYGLDYQPETCPVVMETDDDLIRKVLKEN